MANGNNQQNNTSVSGRQKSNLELKFAIAKDNEGQGNTEIRKTTWHKVVTKNMITKKR